MNDPSQQEKPKNRRQTKLDDRHQQPTLKQLPEAGNKETAKRGQNIACRTLSSHARSYERVVDRQVDFVDTTAQIDS